MKLVISAALLSAMVFYSSLLPFLHSLNLYISTTIHKNYMFLLCNGLLVFIVRNSGLIGNSGDEQSGGNEALGAAMADGNTKIESKVEIGEERENGLVAKDEKIEELTDENEEEEERFNFYVEEEKEEEEERFNFYVEEEEEEEEEDDDDDDEIDEELNKKCEEFIRKMKEGIKFESQQVLVL